MGALGFKNEFDVSVNYPKNEAFQKLLGYLHEKKMMIIREDEPESISYRTKMSLLSYPMIFDVFFHEIDETHTKISVCSSSGQLDLGRSKGMFNDIMKKIY